MCCHPFQGLCWQPQHTNVLSFRPSKELALRKKSSVASIDFKIQGENPPQSDQTGEGFSLDLFTRVLNMKATLRNQADPSASAHKTKQNDAGTKRIQPRTNPDPTPLLHHNTETNQTKRIQVHMLQKPSKTRQEPSGSNPEPIWIQPLFCTPMCCFTQGFPMRKQNTMSESL